MKRFLAAAVVLLYLLHNDLWLWDDGSIVMGLPVGLFYHVVYCAGCAGLMWMLVRHGWPEGLDEESPPDAESNRESGP